LIEIILLLVAITLSIIIYGSYFRKYYFRLKLENEFPDFISLLLTFEANGMRLYEVLDEASHNRIELPRSYMELSKIYSILSRIISDPYTCIKKLADQVPSLRIKRFLKGYAEVMVSTNDTLSYINSYVNEEFSALKTRMQNISSMIDSVFEGFLIIILGVLVYSLISFTSIPETLVLFILILLSLMAYILTNKLLELAYYDRGLSETLLTITLMILSPLIILAFPTILSLIIHYLIIFIAGVILYSISKVLLGLENESLVLFEELYSGARQGLPIDNVFLRVSRRHSLVYERIADMLRMGSRVREALSVVRLPVFAYKVLSLTFTPIEYSRSHYRHLSFVSNIIDYVRGLRRDLRERGKIYYFYVLILPIVMLVFTNTLLNINSSMFMLNDIAFIVKITYIAVFESVIIASIIDRGYWYRSQYMYIVLLVTIILLSNPFNLLQHLLA
jgi:flagellar protein FlaJ